VREIMRALALTAMPDAPAYVSGVAIIRGEPTPVLDLGVLLGGTPVRAQRFISLHVPQSAPSAHRPQIQSSCALAVERVDGIRLMPEAQIQGLPSLLQGAEASMVQAISRQSASLLMLLDSMRLMSLAQDAKASVLAGAGSRA
jgi:purine-binding chemotaxis protein CheW